MATYIYHARNASGNIIKGKIESLDQNELRLHLQRNGLRPLRISEAYGSFKISLFKFNQLEFFKKFSVLLDQNLSLIQCLEILSKEYDGEERLALQQIKNDLEVRKDVYLAFRPWNEYFDVHVLRVFDGIKEASFHQALKSVIHYLESENNLKENIKTSALKISKILAFVLIVSFLQNKSFFYFLGEVLLGLGAAWTALIYFDGFKIFSFLKWKDLEESFSILKSLNWLKLYEKGSSNNWVHSLPEGRVKNITIAMLNLGEPQDVPPFLTQLKKESFGKVDILLSYYAENFKNLLKRWEMFIVSTLGFSVMVSLLIWVLKTQGVFH